MAPKTERAQNPVELHEAPALTDIRASVVSNHSSNSSSRSSKWSTVEQSNLTPQLANMETIAKKGDNNERADGENGTKATRRPKVFSHGVHKRNNNNNHHHGGGGSESSRLKKSSVSVRTSSASRRDRPKKTTNDGDNNNRNNSPYLSHQLKRTVCNKTFTTGNSKNCDVRAQPLKLSASSTMGKKSNKS